MRRSILRCKNTIPALTKMRPSTAKNTVYEAAVSDDEISQPAKLISVTTTMPSQNFGQLGSDLAQRRSVHQSALVPQAVQAALEAERLEVRVEALAVITDLLHDLVGPLVVHAEQRAQVAARAGEALDRRVRAFRLRVDVPRVQAELLGLEHGEQRPLHHVEPAVVAVPHGRSQRLLRDDLGQDYVLVGLRRARGAQRDEARVVGGERVAAPREVGARHFLQLLDHHRLELHVVGAEVVGEVELGRRPGLQADGGAVQLPRALDVRLFGHHEALAVVVVDADEVEPEAGVPRQGPGGVARKEVHLARLQRGEALLRGERRIAHLGRIAEYGRGDRAAQVDVDAAPHAPGVGLREPGNARAYAALQVALRANGVERGLCGSARCDKKQQYEFLHRASPSSRKSRTMAIWSGCIRVGAWPTPAISISLAFGPRRVICAAVSGLSRSESSPRSTSVGQRTAS